MTQRLKGGVGDDQSASLAGSLARWLAGSHTDLDECRQQREKLQCLYVYENLMSNNFRKAAVLKKYEL